MILARVWRTILIRLKCFLFIYLLLTEPVLRSRAQAVSSCGGWGYSLVAGRGLFTVKPSLGAECGL